MTTRQCSKLTGQIALNDKQIQSTKAKLDVMQTKRKQLLLDRKNAILEAFESGSSISDISRLCNLSRQAISLIVNKKES